MAEQLEIVIGANVDDAKAGINSLSGTINQFAQQGKLSIGVLEQSLAQLRAQIKITTDPAEAQKLGQAFKEVQAQINQLKLSDGLAQQLGGVTRAARTSHAEIEGIAQSLRGFAAGSERGADVLSNLVFNFERLAGQTGGVKAAFSAIGETLLGPAGIVLALTTAVQLLGPFVSKLFEAGEASKQAAQEAKKLKDSINGIFDNTGKEATEVLSLIAVLKSETETRERKLEAIKELNKISPETFNNLKLEGNAVQGLDVDYQKYLSSLKTVIAAKIKQAELEQLVTELLKKQGTTATGFAVTISAANKALDENIAKKQKAGEELNSLELIRVEQAKKEAADIKKLNEQIDSLAGDLQKLSTGVKLKVDTTDAQKGLTEFDRKVILLAEEAQKFFNVPLKLRFDTADLDIEKFNKAKEILKGIEDHTIRLRVIIPDKIELPELKPRIDEPGFKKELDDFAKGLTAELTVKLQPKSFLEQFDALKQKLNEDFKFDPKNIQQSLSDVGKFILNDKELQDALKLSLSLDASPEQFAKSINEIKQNIPKSLTGDLDIALQVGDIKTIGLDQSLAKMNEDINKAINDSLKSISTEGFASIGQGIGDALTGGDAGKAFKQFGETLGTAVEALGKQIIALGVAALLTKKAVTALFANPATAIIAGVALVAIGEALKNLIGGGIKGFAEGGRPPVGKPSIIGEKGWEVFVPDVPGTIISHEKSVQLLSNSVTSSSLKEHESIKEYLIATKISQQLKEYLSDTFRSIETNVKILATNNDKLANYSYKLHENIESIKESLVSVTLNNNSSIERIASSFKDYASATSTTRDDVSNIIYKESFDKVNDLIKETVYLLIRDNKTSTSSDIYKTSQSESNISSVISKIVEYPSKELFSTITLAIEKLSTVNQSSSTNSSSAHSYSDFYYSIVNNTIDRRLKESINNKEINNSIDRLKESIFNQSSSTDSHSVINNTIDKLKESISNKEINNNITRINEKITLLNNSNATASIEKIRDKLNTTSSVTTEQLSSFDSSSVINNSIDTLKELVSNKEINNSITKLNDKVSLFNNNSISTSIEKIHEKLNNSDRSVTIERIINNNFYTDKISHSIKEMSLQQLQHTFNIPAFASGGAVFGPTLAILGEGFGISRSNPEFVGTASQLKGIQGGAFDVNINVDGELSFSMGKLTAALNREVRSQLRTSGKNPF